MNEQEMKAHAEQVQAATLAAIEGLKSQWKGHYEELKAAGADHKDVTDKIERALKRLDAVEALVNLSIGQGSTYSDRTLGQQVCEANGLKEWVDQMKTTADKPGYAQGHRFRLPVKSLFDQPETKTTINSTTVGSSTPGILVPQRVPGIVMPGIRRVRVRDLMPRFPTTSNAIEFVKENAFTNAASPVAEGGDKPESALTFTIDFEPVKTLAHWIPASRQILDDFSQLQAYIDMRLMQGLKDQEDEQLLRGDGVGQHLTGLVNEAGAYNTARYVTGDTYIDQLNHAISQIEDVNLEATGIILSPSDWRKVQLIKTEQGGANKGQYLLGGPVGDATPMLWGLPVATTTAMQSGKFFVGDFARYCAVWDRMDARIDISTEHDKFFTQNLIAVRCEERLSFTVMRSDAVLYGSFI